MNGRLRTNLILGTTAWPSLNFNLWLMIFNPVHNGYSRWFPPTDFGRARHPNLGHTNVIPKKQQLHNALALLAGASHFRKR